MNYYNDPLFRFLNMSDSKPCAAEVAPMPDASSSCQNDALRGKSLAMVYAPCQEFEGLYHAAEGLQHGTIFAALDKPFLGDRRTK